MTHSHARPDHAPGHDHAGPDHDHHDHPHHGQAHAHDHHHDHDHGHDHGPEHQGHGHGHHHGHGHSHAPATFGRAFAIGITLNTAYVIAEAVYGVFANSLSLLADAGHNFGDVLGLVAAWLASWLVKRPPSARYTYGLRSSTILAALSNATVLMLVTGAIAWEAVMRLMTPAPTGGAIVMAVAAGGVLVNGFTALMFMSGAKGDLNIRGAFMHMASDALVAVGVVITGGLILLTGWQWLDPAVSLVISGVIVWGTWSLLRESLDLALHAVPAAVDETAVRNYLCGLPGVVEVHDLHIWGMSTTETALTVHLVRPGSDLDDALLRQACAELKQRFRIGHATLQIEAGSDAHPCELASHAVV
ncbi:cation diffusion facilitator family transporter [Caulobacter sp. KR2-114]|uniref:cation diffusion facilitator family transporter n=1 Tax=Caulobacter sp. KR2-114 TaxID=3400912 RepID=UPI003C114885